MRQFIRNKTIVRKTSKCYKVYILSGVLRDSMIYRDLHDFLRRLEETEELLRVRVEVDPNLEVAEIADRVSKLNDGGVALLFEKVKGSRFPLAINLFGSERRICLALGVDDLNALYRHANEFLSLLPDGLAKRWWEFIGFPPKQVEKAPCQEIVEITADLTRYPFLKCWQEDSGKTITLPLVFSADPVTGGANCGMYRVQILDSARVAIHWQPRSGGAKHFQKYLEQGKRMPVAIAIGGEPAVLFSAILPLPVTVDEMRFAGFLRNTPVELVSCLTTPLLVPAGAELVIEGYIESSEMIRGCTFGNHTGFYVPAPDAPVVHVTCVTRKKSPVFTATVVGRPPMEDCWLAKAAERLILPFIQLELPEIVDINLPMEWIFHNSAIVSIDKKYPGHAGEVMHALRKSAWLQRARLLLVVDADLDVRDLSLVAWKVINNMDWQRDLLPVDDRLANSSPDSSFPLSESLVNIDATRKWPEERNGRPWPSEIVKDEAVRRLVDRRWKEYGF